MNIKPRKEDIWKEMSYNKFPYIKQSKRLAYEYEYEEYNIEDSKSQQQNEKNKK